MRAHVMLRIVVFVIHTQSSFRPSLPHATRVRMDKEILGMLVQHQQSLGHFQALLGPSHHTTSSNDDAMKAQLTYILRKQVAKEEGGFKAAALVACCALPALDCRAPASVYGHAQPSSRECVCFMAPCPWRTLWMERAA
jgi:hypothetical protein